MGSIFNTHQWFPNWASWLWPRFPSESPDHTLLMTYRSNDSFTISTPELEANLFSASVSLSASVLLTMSMSITLFHFCFSLTLSFCISFSVSVTDSTSFSLCLSTSLSLQSKDGKTPLHMAASHGRFSRAQSLIKNGETHTHRWSWWSHKVWEVSVSGQPRSVWEVNRGQCERSTEVRCMGEATVSYAPTSRYLKSSVSPTLIQTSS